MPDFITVAYHQDGNPRVILLKSRFKDDGIPCFVKNEFYAKGSQGAQLQIMESDWDRALPILVELKFPVMPQETHYNSFFQKFDTLTHTVPLLKNFTFEVRLLITTILIVGIISTAVYFIMQPTSSDILTSHSWCLERLVHNKQEVAIYSTGIVLVMTNGCRETIHFAKDGRIDLPGINAISTRGQWLEYENQVTISEVKMHGEIYNGDYKLEIVDNNNLTLKSATTIFYLHANPW